VINSATPGLKLEKGIKHRHQIKFEEKFNDGCYTMGNIILHTTAKIVV
jgi:hypothetical protein